MNDTNPVPQAPNTSALAPITGAELSELTPAIRHELDLEQSVQGIVVTSLDPASDAAEAGLRPGDLISAVNRKPVIDMATLRSELGGGSGKSRLVEVLRSGSNTFVALPR